MVNKDSDPIRTDHLVEHTQVCGWEKRKQGCNSYRTQLPEDYRRNALTFNVLVGAQPVPSIECSLSKLKDRNTC